MNSAVMPVPGTYRLRPILPKIFFAEVKAASQRNELVSWIGYPQNAKIIETKTGIRIPLNRNTLHIESGDKILIMRLKYRMEGPKGGEVNPDDFEYFFAEYSI